MASVSCSSPNRLHVTIFYRAVAAVSIATALFFSVPAHAMTVEGVPLWLQSHVLRSLGAVWDEIPAGYREIDRVRTLALVASRLFTGYRITVDSRNTGPHVSFQVENPLTWDVAPVMPQLREPVTFWFGRDLQGIGGEIAPLLEGLPAEALSWVDSALKEQIKLVVERRLPGWSPSLLVRLEKETGILQLSFQPQQPLVLAVTPSIFSFTLPAMFQSDLAAKLIPGLSSIIGLPVVWIARHKEDVEMLAREFLGERNAVLNTRSRVEVEFVPDQISALDAAVESERLIFQVWISAYAGIKGRYPEIGMLLGWNTKHLTGIDLELYGEGLMDISDLDLTSRLGFRFPLWGRLRVGLEMEWPQQELWYRASWDPNRLRQPYAWWRYNSEFGHNAALGYRVNENISIEIHYDSRYDDKLGLRGILIL